ncbi:uncharacterized protein FOMMEDRAFT_16404 [Fomitiporia mediterranea MF3/22]|uniref:uncharacterized protein n=1 Tax=Fomitiporia mediterranea (strain MF3/22) TaxID=694068 RepID=UPI000440881A|nr:uncharacterized protein FOMMEDRAFT_16404 [Fomitiporia mediterranea MF3/22]EJD07784.1 hypothetical protein FOMMEDRAFT_16404 [Fomitiporia mediterranea MF3/22]
MNTRTTHFPALQSLFLFLDFPRLRDHGRGVAPIRLRGLWRGMLIDMKKGQKREREARRERRREKERERGRETEDERERKERKERRKERERARERERERGMKGVGSDSGKEHRRTREGKEKDRGTDTSATETQERLKAARKHHTSRQGTSEQPSGSALTNGAAYMNEIEAPVPDQPNGKANTEINGVAPMPAAVPRDVVGGWGLERSWRASLASNSSDASGPAEDLYAPHRDAAGVVGAVAVGSSHTKMRVREEKDKEKEKKTDKVKGKGKEKEVDVLEPATDDIKDDFVFVASANEEREKERDRHIPFASYPSSSNNILPQPPQSQTPAQAQWQGRERERRTTLSAVPSALGLVLVPSPDGRGGYEYQYQYQYRFPPQSTIQPGSAASGTTLGGKESITPLASLLNSNNQHNGYFFGAAPEMHSRASTASNATLTRRATDSQLQAQAQAHAYGVYPTLRHPRAPSTAPLHVPQPRRVSLTIPEPPESEPESIRSQTRTQPQAQAQTQTQQPFRGGNESYVSSGYPNVESWRDAFSQQQQQQRATAVDSTNGNGGSGGFYANSNPSANMSLDSALASKSLAAAASTSSSNIATGTDSNAEESGGPQHTLRHRTSDSSTASASTGISLTGTTSGERRKQLLDALFMGSSTSTDTGASTSNRSSYASNGSFDEVVANTNANRVSLGRTLDANTAGPSIAGVAKTDPSASTQGQNLVVAPVAQKPVVPPAPRGVPSRDGRPSRGLDMSTRPSTTQPIQTIQNTQAQVPGSTAYPATALPVPSTSHVRQATYPPGTYASSTMAYATLPHAQTQGGQATYGTTAAYPYTYPASAYYQSQPQAHGASTAAAATATATAAAQASRFANYSVAPAAVASAQDHR